MKGLEPSTSGVTGRGFLVLVRLPMRETTTAAPYPQVSKAGDDVGQAQYEVYEQALRSEMQRASSMQEEFSIWRRRALVAEARVVRLEHEGGVREGPPPEHRRPA